MANARYYNAGGTSYVSNRETLTTAFSGTDAVISVLFPRESAITLGYVSDLSYSVLRPKFEVYTLSRISPKAFTKGPRTIAGTIVFTVLGEHPMVWLKEKVEHLRQYKKLKMDELPLFDIIITFGNEYGDSAKMVIYSCTFEDESMEISQMNIYTENVLRFRAKDIEYLKSAYSQDMFLKYASSQYNEDMNDFDLLPSFSVNNLLSQQRFQQKKSMIDDLYSQVVTPGPATTIGQDMSDVGYDLDDFQSESDPDDEEDESTTFDSEEDEVDAGQTGLDLGDISYESQAKIKINIPHAGDSTYWTGWLFLIKTKGSKSGSAMGSEMDAGNSVGVNIDDNWRSNLESNTFIKSMKVRVKKGEEANIEFDNVPSGLPYVALLAEGAQGGSMPKAIKRDSWDWNFVTSQKDDIKIVASQFFHIEEETSIQEATLTGGGEVLEWWNEVNPPKGKWNDFPGKESMPLVGYTGTKVFNMNPRQKLEQKAEQKRQEQSYLGDVEGITGP